MIKFASGNRPNYFPLPATGIVPPGLPKDAEGMFGCACKNNNKDGLPDIIVSAFSLFQTKAQVHDFVLLEVYQNHLQLFPKEIHMAPSLPFHQK